MAVVDAVTAFEGQGAKSFLGFSPLKTAVVDKENEVTDDVPAPHISSCGHLLVIVLYFLLVGAYTGYSIYSYVDRPEVETFSQQPSSRFPPPRVRVSLQCFDSPNCGSITVTRNYSVSPNCPSKTDTFTVETNRTLDQPMDVDLCYVSEKDVVSTNTGSLLRTPGLSIDFSKINTGEKNSTKAHAAVVVEVGDMKKVVGMDSWQVKSFYVGMSVTKSGDKVEKQEYYAQNLQYDGKRPTWRATYIVRLAQLASVYEVTRPGHWLDVVAEVGGAATIVAAILVLSEPCWAKVFPGSERRLAKGRMLLRRAKQNLAGNKDKRSGNDDAAPSSEGDGEAAHLRQKTTGDLPPPRPEDDTSQKRYAGAPSAVATNPLPSLGNRPREGSNGSLPLQVHEAVEAEHGGEWYPAKVTRTDGEAVDLAWSDGTYSQHVPVSSVRRLRPIME